MISASPGEEAYDPPNSSLSPAKEINLFYYFALLLQRIFLNVSIFSLLWQTSNWDKIKEKHNKNTGELAAECTSIF